MYIAAKLSYEKKKGVCLISPLTILDVANMVAASGAPVEYYDLKHGLFECDTNKLVERISHGDVSQLLVTHYFYVQKDFDIIQRICIDYSVSLIEDCAISLGARYKGRSVGSFGDFSVFSFSLFKFLNNFWGGAILCKSEHDRERISSIVSSWRRLSYFEYFPQLLKYAKFGFVTLRPVFVFVFYIFRFGLKNNISIIKNNIQNDPFVRYSGVIEGNCFTRPHDSFFIELSKKCTSVFSELDKRQCKALLLYQGLQNYGICSMPNDLDFSESSFINFPLYFLSEYERDFVAEALLNSGFDCSKQLYRNLSSVEGYAEIPGVAANVAELVRRSLFIPIHRDVEVSNILKIVEVIKEVVKC